MEPTESLPLEEATQAQATPLKVYNAPELTKEQKEQARRIVNKAMNSTSLAQVRKMMIEVCEHNMRLAMEVNEHRAARGYKPLVLVEAAK